MKNDHRLYLSNRRDVWKGLLGTTIILTTPALLLGQVRPIKELRLCLDISPSMYHATTRNWELQLEGHVQALLHPAVIKLLIENQVIVRIILWSAHEQVNLMPGGEQLIQTQNDVFDLVARMRNNLPRVHQGSGTDHSALLDFCNNLPALAHQVIIDVSSDEAPGYMYQNKCIQLRDTMANKGWSINALAIDPNTYRPTVMRGMEKFVQTANGFTLQVLSWSDYVPMILKKIKKELELT